ncbi:hypothetical protein KEM52_006633 [Ascosphaera acerosa]|nr:hypothetical protein KEM52_006633 [Ascosphaera acerosa]
MSRPQYRHAIHALAKDSASLTKAARATSLSFDADPLIRWLRPNAQSWGNLDASTNKWQYRRFQTEIWRGKIVHCQTTQVQQPSGAASSEAGSKSNGLLESQPPTSYGSISPDGPSQKTNKEGYSVIPSNSSKTTLSGDEEEDFSGICILYPPKEYEPPLLSCAGLTKWLMLRWIGIIDWLSPAHDKDDDMERVIMMMTEHDAKAEKYAMQFAAINRPLWYLEVCCVRPSMQGKGAAKAIMQWAMEQVGSDACYLECTDEKNVPFYEKFGFKLYETVRLTLRGDEVKLFMMIRQ